VQKLGPAPLPTCPRIDVCTCSGKYNYYNSTDQQCYSSPYMPDSYNELCGDFSQMKFDGWQFNAKYCDWNHLSDPYENDESMRLASEKVGLGGLGIDPEFDIVIIAVGIASYVIHFAIGISGRCLDGLSTKITRLHMLTHWRYLQYLCPVF